MVDLAVATFNVVPTVNHTKKYDALGPLALVNRRQWCQRHGYPLIETVESSWDRPVCWEKFPVIRQALEEFEWVLWADSDALILDLDLSTSDLCDDRFDIITTSLADVAHAVGVSPDQAAQRFPVTTGVFLIRSSTWAIDLLDRAEGKATHLDTSKSAQSVWDGKGDQEALIAALQEHSHDLQRIKRVDNLECHPRFYRPGHQLFTHFYGNHANHLISESDSELVFQQWARATEEGGSFPDNRATFHWCAIQNSDPYFEVKRGDPERFLYTTGEVLSGIPRTMIRE